MLRRDQSRAATDADRTKLMQLSAQHAYGRAGFEDVDITLVGPNKPNTARWESFGWTVPGDEEHAFWKDSAAREKARQALVASALAKLTPEERDALRPSDLENEAA